MSITKQNYINDKDLSYKAKGLIMVIDNLPSDFKVSESSLATLSKDGRDSVRSGIKELIDKGYLKREKVIDETGKFVRESYQLFWWREVNG